MNITQRTKFSMKAIIAFVVFIIKIWKSASKQEKVINKLSKHLRKEKKKRHPLLKHYKEEPSAMEKIADDIDTELEEER